MIHQNLSAIEKVELSIGIMIFILGAANCIIAFGTNIYYYGSSSRPTYFLFHSLLWIVLPLFVLTGTYIHALKKRRSGFLMAMVGGWLIALFFLAILLASVFSWYYPIWLAVDNLVFSIAGVIMIFVSFICEDEHRGKLNG